MRIQKYLSQNKILSRRETEDYIRKGLILCNGVVVKELGFQMDPEKDKIKVLSPAGLKAAEKITVAVNKPRGVVSSKNKTEGKTVFELFPEFAHLNTVGRLDKMSEGLLLLSNDGIVTSTITASEHKIEKEYEVSVREKIIPGKLKLLERGIMLDDGMTLPTKARIINPHVFRIILKEGRKHQIRRMTDALNLTIIRLKRLRIGNIYVKGLSSGAHRVLSGDEVNRLKMLAK